MSSQKNSGQTKYANSNLNGVFAKSSTSAPHGSGVGTVRTYSGMLVLQKKTRASTTATGTKLSVPKPVNLPSMRKEHAGNDPTTQLVPAGGSGTGWSKPEEPPPPAQPEPRQSSLTAGSTWASTPRTASGLPWQASRELPPPSRGPSFPADRRLNPEEYPTLSATAKAAPAKVPGRPEGQETKSWADDERDVPHSAVRGGGPEWTAREDRFEDERYVGERGGDYSSRGSWEPRDRPGYRYEEYGAPPPPPPRGAGVFDDDYDFVKPRGHDRAGFDGPQPPPPPGRRQQYADERYPEPFYDGGRPGFDTFDDRPLFPPPPPPKQGYGPGPGAQPSGPEADDDDPERKAFEEELARVAAELEKKKAEKLEDEVESAQPDEVAVEETEQQVFEQEVHLPVAVPPPPPPPPPPQPKPPAVEVEVPPPPPSLTPEQQTAAQKTAALAKAKALKEQAEEEERRRRAAAQAKLKELEERIASREAERKAKAAAEAAAKAAAEAAAEAAATAALLPPRPPPNSTSTPISDAAEDDWEKAPAVVDVAAKASHSSAAPHPSAPPASPPNRLPEPAAPPSSAWQQPMHGLTARFGSFDDTLLQNIAKSAAEEKANSDPWVGREQPTPPHPAGKLDATQDAEVPPPPVQHREAWRSDDGDDERGGRGGRGRGERAPRGGRVERGRGRGRGFDGERPGSARSGSDSEGSRPVRGGGRGGRSATTRDGRSARTSLSGPAGKPEDMSTSAATTAAALAAANAALAAATGVPVAAEEKRDRPASTIAQDAAAAASKAVDAAVALPAPTPAAPAASDADAAGSDPRSKRVAKPPRDAAPASVKPPTPAAPTPSQAPAATATKQSRGPSPLTPPAGPSPPSASPQHPASPLPSADLRRESPRIVPDPSKSGPSVPPAASSAPQNIPERRPSSASNDTSAHNRKIAMEMASMTLDEPVTDAVHLPASLDPTPPKPAGPILSPGFDRQIGRHISKAPGSKPDTDDDPLGNGMPPLPAAFLDAAIATSPKAPTLPFATPNMAPIRPYLPAFNFPPTSDGGPPGVAPTAHQRNIWTQGLSFGQPGAVLNQNVGVAGPTWSMGNPPQFPTAASAPNLPAPPTALLMNIGQFGHQPFPTFPPAAFTPPAFGSLQPMGGFPSSQPPFVPTGKLPDWSTNSSGIGSQNSSISPGGGLRPPPLDPLAHFTTYATPASSEGFQPNVGLPGTPGNLPSLAGPNMFPPPPNKPQQHPHMVQSMKGLPQGMAPGANLMAPQHGMHQKDTSKQVNLPDELEFGPDSAITSPKPAQQAGGRPPPGLSLPPNARGPAQQPQHGGQQQHLQLQQHQGGPPGGKPVSGRGRGPMPDRSGGRGSAPGGRGPRNAPPGPPGRRSGGTTPTANGSAGPFAAEQAPAAPAGGPPGLADDGQRGGRGGRGGRGPPGRGGRSRPADTKVMYVPKGNNAPGGKPGFSGNGAAPRADK